jgi:hypothetical protein
MAGTSSARNQVIMPKYAHPTKPGKVTLDIGADPIPTGTLRSIYKQAGWEW